MAFEWKKAYQGQKSAARVRGIAWRFTFETWMSVWEQSGVKHLRGKGRGKYCMARKRDRGAYSPRNVIIITHEQNVADAWQIKRRANKRRARLVKSHTGLRQTAATVKKRTKTMQKHRDGPAYRRKLSIAQTRVWAERRAANV